MSDVDTRVVKATPHKRFFIDMITRDISLEACVLDLIDNSVDGATRHTNPPSRGKRTLSPKPHPLSSGENRYQAYTIDIKFDRSSLSVSDNCGGIPVDIACDYAFNFGRDPEAPDESATRTGIGIYGIGMKRALFKLGRHFFIESQTEDDAFTMDVDVEAWAADRDTWDMRLTPRPVKKTAKEHTVIKVTKLLAGVSQELGSPAFESRLLSAAAQTFAAFLDQGLTIKINGNKVKPMEFAFLQGHGFQPLHEQFVQKVDGQIVDVELWAGAAATRGERPGSDEDDDASPWGWYVLCNNRVVLAADKSERTGWGLAKFPQWHPQYNGYVGIIAFRSESPFLLPWTTTKDDIDAETVLYRKARGKMQVAAREYITYSRARKANPTAAKKAEREAKPVRATAVSKPQSMKTPPVPGTTDGAVNIQYQKPKREVARVAAALGDPDLSATAVGAKTFEYFYVNKVDR